MCFIEKMNCIRIRKKEDHFPDPVHTLGRVGSSIGAQALLTQGGTRSLIYPCSLEKMANPPWNMLLDSLCNVGSG